MLGGRRIEGEALAQLRRELLPKRPEHGRERRRVRLLPHLRRRVGAAAGHELHAVGSRLIARACDHQVVHAQVDPLAVALGRVLAHGGHLTRAVERRLSRTSVDRKSESDRCASGKALQLVEVLPLCLAVVLVSSLYVACLHLFHRANVVQKPDVFGSTMASDVQINRIPGPVWATPHALRCCANLCGAQHTRRRSRRRTPSARQPSGWESACPAP